MLPIALGFLLLPAILIAQPVDTNDAIAIARLEEKLEGFYEENEDLSIPELEAELSDLYNRFGWGGWRGSASSSASASAAGGGGAAASASAAAAGGGGAAASASAAAAGGGGAAAS